MSGRKIVLAASDSESSEYLQSSWRQMLLATLPARYVRYMGTDLNFKNEVAPDGQARYVPHGLRIIEALLLQHFAPEDIAVCYPGQLHLFVGDDTRVVGIHAHNPLGIAFAADVYSHLYGRDLDPINAVCFRQLIEHPALRQHKSHLKIIIGGPGAWQIEKKEMQDPWAIDCVVDGEAEDVAADLFLRAVRGEALPRRVAGHSPKLESIPRIRHRSTFGTVEITRGCGRGCQFCSVALRRGHSIPLDQVLDNVRVQVAEGADTILLVTEDLFLYEQGQRFAVNVPALKRLFESVAAVPGVNHIMMTHATMSPVVVTPEVVEELAPLTVDKSLLRHETSTHPEKRHAMCFVGLETASPRLFEKYMKGKAYPYRAEQWPDVILKGIEIMNRHNWFPMCTWIIGLPEETAEDVKLSLDLLYALKDARWAVIPTLFVPLTHTRLEKRNGAKLIELTDLQWEMFFTCWRYNLDFFRKQGSVQWKFKLGTPIYYHLIARRLFGSGVKYPLYRLGHWPEWFLKRKLYLDLSDGRPTRQAPLEVPVPDHQLRPALPELEASALPIIGD